MTRLTSSPGRFQSASKVPAPAPPCAGFAASPFDPHPASASTAARTRIATARTPRIYRRDYQTPSEKPRPWHVPMNAGTTRAARNARWVRRTFMKSFTSFPLEAEVLERLGGAPVQMRSVPIGSAAGSEIAEGDPRSGAVADRRQLFERLVGGAELLLRVVEPLLFEERTAEDELGIPDLVEEVEPAVQEPERVSRLLLGLVDVAGPQVDLGKRRHRLRGVGIVPEVESDAEGLLEMRDSLLRLPEEEIESADVIEQTADVPFLGEILEDRLGLLRVRAGKHPVTLALGDERRLEVDGCLRGLEVALAPVAARARLEDPRTEQVARQVGALGELQSRVEKPDRGGDAGKLVAGDAELVDNLGTLYVGEAQALRELAGALEQRDRPADVALDRPSPGLALQGARFELRRSCREHRRAKILILGDRIGAAVGLDQRLGARETALDPSALVGRDTVRQEACVDAQPLGEPLDRLGGRARFPALDLAEVLLREAIAGNLALGESRGDSDLAQAFAEAQRSRLHEALRLRARRSIHKRRARSLLDTSPKCKSQRTAIPLKGHVSRVNQSTTICAKSLDRVT